MQKGQK